MKGRNHNPFPQILAPMEGVWMVSPFLTEDDRVKSERDVVFLGWKATVRDRVRMIALSPQGD